MLCRARRPRPASSSSLSGAASSGRASRTRSSHLPRPPASLADGIGAAGGDEHVGERRQDLPSLGGDRFGRSRPSCSRLSEAPAATLGSRRGRPSRRRARPRARRRRGRSSRGRARTSSRATAREGSLVADLGGELARSGARSLQQSPSVKDVSSSPASRLSRSCSATQLPPALWRTTWPSTSGATPVARPRASASQSATTWTNQSMLVRSFVAVPGRGDSRRGATGWPITSKIGVDEGEGLRARSHHEHQRPVTSAVGGTGDGSVDKHDAPRPSGLVEAAGMTRARWCSGRRRRNPASAGRANRSRRDTIASTSAGPGSDTQTASASASSARPVASRAPSATSGATRSGARSMTRSDLPARSRLLAIGPPIEPRPTKPIVEPGPRVIRPSRGRLEQLVETVREAIGGLRRAVSRATASARARGASRAPRR